MQIYLIQNGKQEGPFGLPRIASRLVSGDLDSATPAWRDGMSDWHPLHHPVWAEAGIVAPPPQAAASPVQEVATADEPEAPAAESVAPEEDTSQDDGDESASSPSETSSSHSEEVASESKEEQSGYAFASYREEDFKPPSYEQMEEEMAQLRAKRETFPELIGRQAFESGLRDEEIDEAVAEVEKLSFGGSEDRLPEAYVRLGRAVMAAGITDPALDEVRERARKAEDKNDTNRTSLTGCSIFKCSFGGWVVGVGSSNLLPGANGSFC